MKIASHDSMTYLKPSKWYMYPFRFMARCQSKKIDEQFFDYNVRLFDLRIGFKDGHPVFRHGFMVYKGDVNSILYGLNKWTGTGGDKTKVRLILEEPEDDKSNKNEELFKKYCKVWEFQYTNLEFFGGNRKWDWKVIYDFNNPEPGLDNKYSSMTMKSWDDWFPYLYAKFMNKKNIKKGTDKEYLFIDFLHIQ